MPCELPSVQNISFCLVPSGTRVIILHPHVFIEVACTCHLHSIRYLCKWQHDELVAESTTRSLSTIRFNAPHRIAKCGLNTLACSHLSSCVRQRRRFSVVDRVRRRENGGDGRVVAHASHPSASDPIVPPSSSRSPRSRVSVRLRSRLSPPFPVALLLSSFALSFFFLFENETTPLRAHG